MRCMVMVKANRDTEAGVMPSEELMAAMGRFNEALVAAGIMEAGEGLKPSREGARVRFDGDQRTVLDGPFAETKEQLAGFYLIDVPDLDAALTWARRHPGVTHGAIEVRPVWG